MRRKRSRLILPGALTLGFALSASALDGQEAAASRTCVSADLPVKHWSVEQVSRLRALGLSAYDSADQVLHACRVDEIFREAQREAGTDSVMVARIASWRALLAEEGVHAGAEADGSAIRLSRANMTLGVSGSRGVTAPGLAEFPPDRTGSQAVPDGQRLESSFEASVELFGLAHLAGGVSSSGRDLDVDRLELTAPLGPMVGTIGRGYNRMGDAKGGSIVFSGVAPLDRLEVSTRAPFRLPGFLRHVGALSFSTLLASVQDDRHEDEPFFWAMRGSVQPHPRVRFSVNRGALFGGDQPLRLNNLGMMFLGRVQGKGFEDQVVSVEGSFRLPTEEVIPLTLVAEWGAEDAAGAWWAVPGLVVSLQAPALPGAPGIGVAVEYAYFGTSCCLNPEWYRHWSFPGSWALGDQPMGHPLGGNGSELLLATSSISDDARLRLRNDLFVRSRDEENLYVPGREGRSAGVRSQGIWRASDAIDLDVGIDFEVGDGWTERSGNLSIKLHL